MDLMYSASLFLIFIFFGTPISEHLFSRLSNFWRLTIIGKVSCVASILALVIGGIALTFALESVLHRTLGLPEVPAV